MKRAILHIGTEKTGSTSVQRFLFENRGALKRKGWLFPKSAGYLSNHRLVVYAKRHPEADLIQLGSPRGTSESLERLRTGFLDDHCHEVLPFMKGRWPRDRTLVYSSEHMQSRLTTTDEITRVARLLRPQVDRIEVIVYLRRQDRLAASAHSTSMRSGDVRDFDFEGVNASGPYYDHLTLLENWSAVFGDDAIRVRLFERGRLSGGDVVRDFVHTSGIDRVLPRPVFPVSANEALSWTAQAVLRTFNRLADDDPILLGIDRAAFVPYLLNRLEGIADEHGQVLPSRTSARAFYARFEEANARISERWLGGEGFDERFDDYPDDGFRAPVVADAKERLHALIVQWQGDGRKRA